MNYKIKIFIFPISHNKRLQSSKFNKFRYKVQEQVGYKTKSCIERQKK